MKQRIANIVDKETIKNYNEDKQGGYLNENRKTGYVIVMGFI